MQRLGVIPKRREKKDTRESLPGPEPRSKREKKRAEEDPHRSDLQSAVVFQLAGSRVMPHCPAYQELYQ